MIGIENDQSGDGCPNHDVAPNRAAILVSRDTMPLQAARQVNCVVRRQKGLVTAVFVSDTNPDLRSLLSACQAADDPGEPLSALASWLDRRQDPRGPLVRLGARFWYATHGEADIQGRPEFDDLERSLDEQGDAVLTDWLGLTGDGDTVGFSWHSPLVSLWVNQFDALPVQGRAVVSAGWVWGLGIVGPRVDEALSELLA